jgi:uncharacterized SAM-binding protein YcdF (DUF218 family)
MFVLSKLFTFLFLPPGLFLLLAAAALLFYLFGKRRFQRLTLLFLTLNIALLYCLSITPVQNLLLTPLENAFPSPSPSRTSRADYIVVLGGGTIPSSPAEQGRGALSPSALKRVAHAVYLHREHRVPIIVSGGIVFRGTAGEAEAVVARRALIKLGVDASAVITETESRNTWENAQNTAALLTAFQATRADRTEQRGRAGADRDGAAGDRARRATKAGGGPADPLQVLLVTSAYHMRRSVLSFRSAGLSVIPAPTDYKSRRTRLTLIDFLPGMTRLLNSSTALHEYVGILYYRLAH